MTTDQTQKPKPDTYLTSRFHEALEFAVEQHKDDVRKSTTIAYICHPIGVASLVIEAGGDEDQIIGALLHDVAEDHGGEKALSKIKELFGPRVEKIVRGCSDSLTEDPDAKDDWKKRKLAHIAHLNSITDMDILIVTAADKTHNARAIVTDLQIEGCKVWERFSVTKSSEIIWYYEEMYKALKHKNVPKKLMKPLKTAIKQMTQGSR